MKQQRDEPAASFLERVLPHCTETKELLHRIHRELVTSRGVMLAGAEARPIPNISTGGGKVATAPGTLAGYSLRETTGAAGAIIELWDDGTNGDLLVSISLSAGESTRDWFMPLGIGFVHGCRVVVVSGTITGAVYIAPPP